jgi:hypothetical protein
MLTSEVGYKMSPLIVAFKNVSRGREEVGRQRGRGSAILTKVIFVTSKTCWYLHNDVIFMQ